MDNLLRTPSHSSTIRCSMARPVERLPFDDRARSEVAPGRGIPCSTLMARPSTIRI
jgi:hypothetical protein